MSNLEESKRFYAIEMTKYGRGYRAYCAEMKIYTVEVLSTTNDHIRKINLIDVELNDKNDKKKPTKKELNKIVSGVRDYRQLDLKNIEYTTTDSSTELMDSWDGYRSYMLFNTYEDAVMAKIKSLSQVRSYFEYVLNKEQNKIKTFNKNVNKIMIKTKEKNPEYFLWI